MSAPDASSFIKPLHYVLLALAALIFLLPGIATLPPIDRDEARFVQASKQMLESGDYIDIKLQEVHRYKKPIGIYWLQTAAVTLTGGDAQSGIWRYRLVSTAAAIASVLLIALIGARMFGANVGLASGIMLAGLFGLAFEGRIAKTDATLLALTLLAQAALAHIYLASKDNVRIGRHWPFLLWVAIGTGVLIKGPITLLIAGLTTAGLVIFDKDRSWIRSLNPWWGLAIVAGITAPWLIAITLKSDGAFWAESVGKDMLGKVTSGQETHWGPPGYYVLTYSLYMWPFGYLAGLGALAAMQKWREPRILFCLVWHIPFWLIMEMLPTKLPHYPLPVYPPFLILAGWALFATGQTVALLKWHVWILKLSALGLAVVTLALAALAIGIVPYSEGHISWSGVIAAVFAIAAGWLASGLGKTAVDLPRLAAASVAAEIFYSLAFSTVLPAANMFWISRSVQSELAAIDNCPAPSLASSSFHEPSLVFLVGTQTKLTDLQGAARHLTSEDPCAFALVPEENKAELQSLVGTEKPLELISVVSGFNYSKGTQNSLALIRVMR